MDETNATLDDTGNQAGIQSGNASEAPAADLALLEDEMLVEEISIDGMCGVY